MFLDSGYKASTFIPEESDITIYDVAVLLAHVGTKPILKINRTNEPIRVKHLHLTSFWIQGMILAKREMPLFDSNFEIVDGHIESPEIRHLFGEWDQIVSPFNSTDHVKSLLSPVTTGYSLKDNLFVQEMAWERFPLDQDKVMEDLLSESFVSKASLNDGVISKADMKEYFENFIKKDLIQFDLSGWSQEGMY